MQAPSTSSGAPAQEPEERPCPSCGAANGLAAAFCWQCYRPFGAQAPAQVGAANPGGAWGRPGFPSPSDGWSQTSAPLPPAAPKRNLGTMIGVIVVTLAVIAGVVFFLGREDAVAAPESLGGMPLIENEQTKIVVDTFRAQVDTNGIEGDMAIYGNGAPSAALIWIRDASVPTTDAAFEEFASGFDAGIGGSGSLGAQTSETIQGVTYVCAPVLGAATGTLCMWQDGDVFWLLFDFSGDSFRAGRDLAVVAHDAVGTA